VKFLCPYLERNNIIIFHENTICTNAKSDESEIHPKSRHMPDTENNLCISNLSAVEMPFSVAGASIPQQPRHNFPLLSPSPFSPFSLQRSTGPRKYFGIKAPYS